MNQLRVISCTEESQYVVLPEPLHHVTMAYNTRQLPLYAQCKGRSVTNPISTLNCVRGNKSQIYKQPLLASNDLDLDSMTFKLEYVLNIRITYVTYLYSKDKVAKSRH